MEEDNKQTDEIILPKIKSWKELSLKKKVFAILCITILLGLLLALCIFKDQIIVTTETFKYPDGCNETWVNGKINSTNCTLGRAMIELNNNNRFRVIEPTGLGVFNNLTR